MQTMQPFIAKSNKIWQKMSEDGVGDIKLGFVEML